MICVPLGDCLMRGLLNRLGPAAKAGGFIEIRADSIRDFSLVAFLKRKIQAPLIFTCYAKSNGGLFEGSEKERTKLLAAAIVAGRFAYVTIDIPESLWISDEVKALIHLGRQRQTKIILACHNYQKTPDNLAAIYKQLAAFKPDAIKIITYARNFSDNFKIFKLAQRVVSRRRPKLIAFCMGEKGLTSRILYRKFGLFLTYASYETGRETADGQIPVSFMKYLYRADAINRQTRIFGLLGNPVRQSYSPFLFNTWFSGKKSNAVYLPLAIDPKYFREDLALIKSFLKPAGFSVTSPYKMAAIKLVDRLSKSAKEIRAINTIYHQGNKFIGANTDWIGAIEAFWSLRKLLKDRQALVLGRGGAAQAIIYALRNSGIKTTVFSRKGGKNIVRLDRLPQYCKGSGTDKIIINATPIGMWPDTGKSPMPKACLKKGIIVFDTIYNPVETRLLKDARRRGCITVNGLRMFLGQAFKQIEYFNRSLSR